MVSVIMQQFDDAISITVAIVIVVTVAFIQVRHLQAGRNTLYSDLIFKIRSLSHWDPAELVLN